jgi:hypothetical protein
LLIAPSSAYLTRLCLITAVPLPNTALYKEKAFLLYERVVLLARTPVPLRDIGVLRRCSGECCFLTQAPATGTMLLDLCATALDKEQHHDDTQDARDNPDDLSIPHVP